MTKTLILLTRIMTTPNQDTLNSPKQRNTVNMHYVRAACENAENGGLDVEACLEHAGLQLSLLSEPNARVSAQRYEKLTGHIAKLFDDELLLQGGVPRSRVGCFNMMCQLAIHEPTLRQGIQQCLRFYRLLWRDIRYELTTEDELAFLSIHFDDPSIDPRHTVKDCGLVLLHRFFCWLINAYIPLHHVSYTFPQPEYYEEHNRLYRCPIHYGAKFDGIAFSQSMLATPVVQTKDTLSQFLREAPGNLMVIPSNEHSLTSQIRVVLARSLYTDQPSLELIASALNTTTQTVRRKLKKENTSYQEIKDQLRQDSAINFLCNSNLPINDIALRLGFSEPSTFHRAFKKWTGTTPGHYRK